MIARSQGPGPTCEKAIRASGDWSFVRVKVHRQEGVRFEAIARASGASTNEILGTFIRRTVEAGELPFDVAAAGADEPWVLDRDVTDSGMPVDRTSKIGASADRASHPSHVAPGRLRLPGDEAGEQGQATLDESLAVLGNFIIDRQIEEHFMGFLASDQLVPMASFLARAGWTKRTLSRAETGNRIFHLELRGIRAYPSFYLDRRFDQKELGSVCRAMQGISGGAKWQFFTTPKASLAVPARGRQKNGTPRTPLQALIAGEYEAVERAALGFYRS